MAPSIAQLPEETSFTKGFYGELKSSVDSKASLEKVIRDHELVPLWNTGAPPTAYIPHSKHIPAVWKYEETKSLLLRAADLVDAKEAERRAVLMINPGPRQPPFTLDTLLAAHQLIIPGEQALCHRHTPFAVRFLIEGDSGYTAVSGKKMFMAPGDLIITPSWNWHDHGNAGQTNVIWLDGLNIPLFKHIPVDFTEHYEEKYGALTHDSKVVSDDEASDMKFPWVKTQSRLDAAGGNYATFEYLLPHGKSVSTTIGAYATRVAAGKASRPVQETSSNIFQVHSGKGYTEVTSPDGEQYTLRWGKSDSFCIPSWYRFQIFAEDEDAYLFSFSDKPMQATLGYYRSKDNQVERLESRVASMEQMFRQFLDQFQSIQSKQHYTETRGAAAQPPTEAPVQDDVVNEQSFDSPDPEADSEAEPSITLTDNPHVSKIQQLLDAAEADASSFPGSRDDDVRNDFDRQSATEDLQTCDSHDHQGHDRDDGRGRCYADGFGELDVDSHGQLRYVGLGSTASVAVENCIGLRRYITKGLEKKGYEMEESFFTSPEATLFEETANSSSSQPVSLDLPPPPLVDALVSVYARELAHLFPITTGNEIRHGYHKLLTAGAWDPGHAAAFFALLAVASPLIPADDTIFGNVDNKWASAGPVFYNQAMHYVNLPFNGKSQRKERSQDIVVALGLLSMYLAETGSQAEAWISVGRAIRIAQDIGLHRSPERLRLPRDEWNRRRYIWWCLYILERQLCTALGRPLSINDEDCDTEIPAFTAEAPGADFAGFTSMIHLHRIIGNILKIVNSVRNADSWRSAADNGKKDELQARVREANDALQTWAKDMVPPDMKTAKSGTLLAEKHIALSSFFSAVMLLHRAFIRNPHRPSPLAGSQAQLKSAKAATDCIRGTAEFFQCVPKSHFMVFHGQYVFVSALILLSCARWSDDPKFVYQALRDVEEAMQVLQGLEPSWKGAKKCRGTVEEYLEFTFHVLQGNRKCRFDCEYGYQPHDSNSCKTAKRPSSESTGGGSEPKKARVANTSQHRGKSTMQGPGSHSAPVNERHLSKQPTANISGHQTACPPTLSPIDRMHSMPTDTYFFDNTINNFLGAIDPGIDFAEQFDFFLDMGINSSGVAFLSPDNEQNSFF
ncbi:putative Zn(2)-C6 fungal-type domain-containing protein [Seiridium cardinale]